jgi:hypothetical protein
MVLADTQGEPLSGVLQFQDRERIWETAKTFEESEDDSGRHILIAHAKAPGFETYSTHWHSVILQYV